MASGALLLQGLFVSNFGGVSFAYIKIFNLGSPLVLSLAILVV